MSASYETLAVREDAAVLFVEIAAPPMNLLGPELVRDLVSLIRRAEADEGLRVLVFTSADPDYFISHVDVTRIKENREEAAKLAGEASIALLLRHLSVSRLVSIAQIEGRVRGVGSEFVLACDMRFAARESAVFCQFEPAFGVIPGAGGAQHLARLMGRGRALEVMLSAEDYDAELAERYGWINRALPAETLGDFVKALAHRIARFPAAGHVAVKELVNTVALAPVEDLRRDSDLFVQGLRSPESESRTQAAMERGFQTREAELALPRLLGDLELPGMPGAAKARRTAGAGRVFELRTYTAAPGKLGALKARFRSHTLALFKKHGMEVVGFWQLTDEKPGAGETLVYILAHPSRAAAEANWKALGDDPVWVRVKADSEKEGALAAKIERVFMAATDYSPLE